MPPSCAMAMAKRASVTVSMAAETSGKFKAMLREKRVARLVSLGRTWENAGTNNTSSKVSALPRRRMSKLQKSDCTRVNLVLPHPARYTCRHETVACILGRHFGPLRHRHLGPMAVGGQGWTQGLQ